MRSRTHELELYSRGALERSRAEAPAPALPTTQPSGASGLSPPVILELMLSEKLREFGVVGAGGAGFPTYVKAQSQVEFMIAVSEERRVGKECRSRGPPYHEK